MTPIETGLVPKPAGEAESLVVASLPPGTRHRFRLQVVDEAGNLSELSNEAEGTTLPVGPLDGMVLIPPGTFTMGSPTNEPGHGDGERAHLVTLSRAFCLAPHEVTQAEWLATMDWEETYFDGDDLPVEEVSWFDCLEFCNRRSFAAGLDPAYRITGAVHGGVHIIDATVVWTRDAGGYRLPTEAEWEYACRAGSTTAFTNGPIEDFLCGANAYLDASGWSCGTAQGSSHAVGGKTSNALGLYDVHGNVWEWCWDRLAPYSDGPSTDPSGPTEGESRVFRGGSWHSNATECRSATRAGDIPGYIEFNRGLRLCRNAESARNCVVRSPAG
jgi:formylglycine-generating enzyme required for sulfatase activity